MQLPRLELAFNPISNTEKNKSIFPVKRKPGVRRDIPSANSSADSGGYSCSAPPCPRGRCARSRPRRGRAEPCQLAPCRQRVSANPAAGEASPPRAQHPGLAPSAASSLREERHDTGWKASAGSEEELGRNEKDPKLEPSGTKGFGEPPWRWLDRLDAQRCAEGEAMREAAGGRDAAGPRPGERLKGAPQTRLCRNSPRREPK